MPFALGIFIAGGIHVFQRRKTVMLFEMHCHTSRYSKCSKADPVDCLIRAVAMRLDGLVLTEHEYLWEDEELEELKKVAEVDPGFVVLSGQEVSTEIGHVLVYGAPKSIRSGISVEEIRHKYPHAALVWAHPWRKKATPSRERLTYPALDAVEIFNKNHTARENYEALIAWHSLRFPAVAGSDAHRAREVGLCPTVMLHPAYTVTQLAEEIRNRRCHPKFKEHVQIGRNSSPTRFSIGTGTSDSPNRLLVRRARSSTEASLISEEYRISDLLWDNGFSEGRFRVPEILERDFDSGIYIESDVKGETLLEGLRFRPEKASRNALRMSAQWLAKLHSWRLNAFDTAQSCQKELYRLNRYHEKFTNSNTRYRVPLQAIVRLVREFEEEQYRRAAATMVLNHGDYQPANIIIGSPDECRPEPSYVCAVDFANSLMMNPAFDVGYFISQTFYQLRYHTQDKVLFRDNDFIADYLSACPGPPQVDFLWDVGMFRLRANLSILSFLVSVGKGESSDMADLVEQSVALQDILI